MSRPGRGATGTPRPGLPVRIKARARTRLDRLGFGQLHEFGEAVLFTHGQIGENLAVEFHPARDNPRMNTL